MNGPILAGTIVAGVFLLIAWMALVFWKRAAMVSAHLSFLGWFVPLFYFGGWAAGGDWKTLSAVLFFIGVLYVLFFLRTMLETWVSNLHATKGPEREVKNRDSA